MYVITISNLFAVKLNILSRLFHPYGIIRRGSKTTYNNVKVKLQMQHKNLLFKFKFCGPQLTTTTKR